MIYLILSGAVVFNPETPAYEVPDAVVSTIGGR